MKPFIALTVLALFSSIRSMAAEDPIFKSGSQPSSRSAVTIFKSIPVIEQVEIEREMERLNLNQQDLESAQLSYDNGTVTVKAPEGAFSAEHLAYIGLRLGIPFLLGLNATYIHSDASNENTKFHIDIEAATVVFVNTLNIAFGYHPTGGSFYFGGRLHQITLLQLFDAGQVQNLPGMGAELGWLWQLGENKAWLASLKVGGLIFSNNHSDTIVVPDVKIGIAVKLYDSSN